MTEFFNIKAMAFEAIAVMVLIVGAVLSIGHFVMQVFQGTDQHEVYQNFRENFGLSLMLAVDLLVAVNIILTVAPLDLSFESPGTLGLLVLIRAFLHFIQITKSFRPLWVKMMTITAPLIDTYNGDSSRSM